MEPFEPPLDPPLHFNVGFKAFNHCIEVVNTLLVTGGLLTIGTLV